MHLPRDFDYEKLGPTSLNEILPEDIRVLGKFSYLISNFIFLLSNFSFFFNFLEICFFQAWPELRTYFTPIKCATLERTATRFPHMRLPSLTKYLLFLNLLLNFISVDEFEIPDHQGDFGRNSIPSEHLPGHAQLLQLHFGNVSASKYPKYFFLFYADQLPLGSTLKRWITHFSVWNIWR